MEAYELDVLREPRLSSADRHYAGRAFDDVLDELQDEFKCVLVAGGKHCPFLSDDNSCSIYPTRPNDCVGMEKGKHGPHHQSSYLVELDGAVTR